MKRFLLTCILSVPIIVHAQPLKTPLSQDVLDILTNEISGQLIFNNEVKLAGAPWIRDAEEFTDTLYESAMLYKLTKGYGIENVELNRIDEEGTFDYPLAGEFRIVEPKERLVARLGADVALIARGSQSVDMTGELIYIPRLTQAQIDTMLAGGLKEEFEGKVALMWSHVRGETAAALDSAGLRGVVSYSSRDRYMDPNQVVYGRGSYAQGKNLTFGFSISWRQWSELMEDLETGKMMKVHCMADIGKYDEKYEAVFSWIPGTEPDKKGVIFTGHLFEGYTKRGANDNMSGCVVQLEILRALTKLIKEGKLPQPRRNIYFLWPDEIGGTYAFIREHADLVDNWSININMDMVGEGLRINNGVFTLSECPNHLPNYFDGLAKSILNYVWRTNDIVYLPDSPRGRPGGQYFPIPMMEKNGSTDAFRFTIHQATGGSDHICFNNPSVAVPGIEYNVWPDQWYHADTDLPDKSDPTQMKRIAFIGAACAWIAANCTDEVLPGLIETVSEFGYYRVAEREHVKALRLLENAEAGNIDTAYTRALDLVELAATREKGALTSIADIYTGSKTARRQLQHRIQQWELHHTGLNALLSGYAVIKAKALGVKPPTPLRAGQLERQYRNKTPDIHRDVERNVFNPDDLDSYESYIEENPDAMKDLGLGRGQRRSLMNFINGNRPLPEIWKSAMAETEGEIPFEKVVDLFKILEEIGWIEY